MKQIILKRGLFQLLVNLIVVSAFGQDVANQPNIILMIGDGMGVTQVYAGLTANHGVLNMEQFKHTGFVKTYSATDYTTDSGAGGTAISTGKKTYYQAIGVDVDTLPVKTILEYAEEKGLATGMVTTSSITDATPASFIAHQSNRYNLDLIAEDFLKTDIDVFIGGGSRNFIARRDTMDIINEYLINGYQVVLTRVSRRDYRTDSIISFTTVNLVDLSGEKSYPDFFTGHSDSMDLINDYLSKGHQMILTWDSTRHTTTVKLISQQQGEPNPRFYTGRGDSLDLISELRDRGYQVLFSMDSIKNVTSGKLAGFTAMDHNPSFNQGRGDMLPVATETAINILANKNTGFFLMVEGAHIDKQAHTRNTDDIVKEVIDFDQAVGKVLDFARKDGNTLVIVTADHETAGMNLVDGNFETGEVTAQYNERGDHTGVMVPIFAFGPGAESFQGMQENTDLFFKMMAVLGITPDESK